VIPLLLALIGSVTVLPQRYQLIALRSVILVTVCLLPAVMWFLFIATRKASLLVSFLASLYRLGLLTPSPRSSSASPAADPAHDQRLMSYLQKFESVYGRLPQSARDGVLKRESARTRRRMLRPRRGRRPPLFPSCCPRFSLHLAGWSPCLPPRFPIRSPAGIRLT
jgi:hypothetical protein